MTINKVGQSPFYTEGEQAAIAFGAPGACSAPTPAILLASSAFIFDMLRMFLQSYNLYLKSVYAYQKKKAMGHTQSSREDL